MFIEEPRTEGVCLSGSRAWFVRIYDRERDLLPAAARGGGDLGGGSVGGAYGPDKLPS